MIHDFNTCLAASHAAEDLPFWEECYRKAFSPYFADMVSHRKNGLWQQQGIDRTVILETSKTFTIDEKVRWKDYGDDVLLEFVSVDSTGAPGWVCKPLTCDFIAYAIAPRGLCLLLPVVQLQQAWTRHGEQWKQRYGVKRAKNKRYWTLNVPVPFNVLFPAIGAGLRVTFTPVQNSNGENE